MARNPAASARAVNSAAAAKPSKRSSDVEEAIAELIARGEANAEGAALLRADPLQDALAARALAAAIDAHKTELRRRGLFASHAAAALQLADQVEGLLQGVAGAALDARGRSAEMADLLADAAASAHAVREAVARVTRGPKGRAVAREFGLGEACNARRPAHVLRALNRILTAAESHPEIVADLGMLEEDRTTLRELAKELSRAPASERSDGSEELHAAHGALRALFDLVAAKTALAFSGDPDERARILAMIPRATERRHLRRAD